jgi:hypothetical protein
MDNIKIAAEEILRKSLLDSSGYFYNNQVDANWPDLEIVFKELSPYGKRCQYERHGANPIFQINEVGRYFISNGGWSEIERQNHKSDKRYIWTISISIATLIATIFFGCMSIFGLTRNKNTNVTDRRTELYNNLINSHKVSSYEIGSLKEFKKAIHDEKSSQEFYRNISSIFTEEEIGTEEDFINSIKDDFK